MLYLDTSALLKLFIREPETDTVRRLVGTESRVVVSSLTQLETMVRLKAAWKGGDLTRSQHRRTVEGLTNLISSDPFALRTLSGSVFQTALRQHESSGTVHCRSLDRLHLAAMEELDIRRLMTKDAKQAEAARAMGFEVLVPEN